MDTNARGGKQFHQKYSRSLIFSFKQEEPLAIHCKFLSKNYLVECDSSRCDSSIIFEAAEKHFKHFTKIYP